MLTGDGGFDFINVALREGGVVVNINLGQAVLEVEVKDVRFDDNRWHKLVITRESREVGSEYIMHVTV